MNKVVKQISYIEVADIAELTSEEEAIIKVAKEATKGSYAPYSQFHVGAALVLDGGIIVKGANQENGAYPSGLCAERTALFAAGANCPDKAVKILAIAAETKGEFVDEPIVPCGACLQVILETEMRAGAPITILLHGNKRTYKIEGVSNLLPFAFTLK